MLQKILLENVVVNKAKRYTKGNVPYDLNLQHYSSITSFGEVDIFKKINATEITFEKNSKATRNNKYLFFYYYFKIFDNNYFKNE